jgi:8-oxo-dGTP pyrophosphatase MutT (NUDIX family)
MDVATDVSHPPLPKAVRLAAGVEAVLDGTPHSAAAAPGREAAVLVLIYDRGDAPHVVLTKRTDTLEHHPGQVSLPGGRPDLGDSGLAATALRETHEELGVAPDAVRIVGRLPDVPTTVSGFVISPFVGVSELPLHPVPSEHEIARVLEVPIAALLLADARLPAVPDILSLRYPLGGEDVWGATARILRAFAAVVRQAIDGTSGVTR